MIDEFDIQIDTDCVDKDYDIADEIAHIDEEREKEQCDIEFE